ncbi:hypothetical protein EAO77_15695, partial [Streptomyces sp. t39]
GLPGRGAARPRRGRPRPERPRLRPSIPPGKSQDPPASRSARSMAARSAEPTSTQNSLPAGSARTAQPLPFGLRRSSTRRAPRAVRRSTSASRVPSGWRSRWMRFFRVFASGTRMNRSVGRPSGTARATSSSPGSSTGSTG